jgi:two-component system nitrogen regulation sensor histidine kinase NtrY
VLANLTPVVPTDAVVRALVQRRHDPVPARNHCLGVWRVFQACCRGRAGSRLHIRIVTLFSVIAAVPAILMAVVASITVDRGFDRLFSRQTQSLVENAASVANAYLEERLRNARADTIATANELALAKPLYEQNHDQFKQFITAQADSRGPRCQMLDKNLNVIDQAEAPLNQAFLNKFSKPTREALALADEKEPQLFVFLEYNYVAAVIKLRTFSDTYLYVAHLVEPRVAAQVRESHLGAAQFAELQERRSHCSWPRRCTR